MNGGAAVTPTGLALCASSGTPPTAREALAPVERVLARVDFSDWLLAMQVLAAFALIGALVLFSALMVAGWAVDRPQRVVAYSRLGAIGGPLVGGGGALALLLGIALAIDLDDYHFWTRGS